MLTSPRLPQLPRAQGRPQSGFYAQTMAAGYGIFTHFSYQHGGLVSPAHKKLSSSISRSNKPGTLTYFQPLPFPVGEEEIALGKPLRLQIPLDEGVSLRRAPVSMDTELPAVQSGNVRSRTQAIPELPVITRPVLYRGRPLSGRWSDQWSRAFPREAQITNHRSLAFEGNGTDAVPKTCERRLFSRGSQLRATLY
jgi:hypothetical protein